MRLSKQARRDAKQLFLACQAGGVLVEERVKQAVSQVLEQKPRGYLGILHHFERLVKLDLERRAALVETATPLAQEQKKQVGAGLVRLYGEGLAIQYVTTPDLVGGMRVRVGSDVFDGSILGRLERLKEAF